jgi:hypothetical protein
VPPCGLRSPCSPARASCRTRRHGHRARLGGRKVGRRAARQRAEAHARDRPVAAVRFAHRSPAPADAVCFHESPIGWRAPRYEGQSDRRELISFMTSAGFRCGSEALLSPPPPLPSLLSRSCETLGKAPAAPHGMRRCTPTHHSYPTLCCTARGTGYALCVSGARSRISMLAWAWACTSGGSRACTNRPRRRRI